MIDDNPVTKLHFLFSLVVISANLLVDIVYQYLDPRITY